MYFYKAVAFTAERSIKYTMAYNKIQVHEEE